MNWINSVVRPKIRGLLTTTTKREPPDDFWKKCPSCGQMLDHKALEDNLSVFPCCGHHARVSAEQRLKMIFDGGHFDKIEVAEVPLDPLKFRDEKRYTDRLKAAKAATNLEDAVLVASAKLNGQRITTAAQDFRFMGGSLGMAAGEAILTGMLRAVKDKTPFILFAASGGARMQEGILSLMQMPRTTIAIQALREARLPYIVVLTDPTTGGVTASYAMLGDIQIAEPGALICFAGPRVIEQTIREQLPDGFQRAEYLLEHGMIDMVVKRENLRQELSKICRILMGGVKRAKSAEASKEASKDRLGAVNGYVIGAAVTGSVSVAGNNIGTKGIGTKDTGADIGNKDTGAKANGAAGGDSATEIIVDLADNSDAGVGNGKSHSAAGKSVTDVVSVQVASGENNTASTSGKASTSAKAKATGKTKQAPVKDV